MKSVYWKFYVVVAFRAWFRNLAIYKLYDDKSAKCQTKWGIALFHGPYCKQKLSHVRWKGSRLVDTINQLIELFSVALVREYPSRSSVWSWKQRTLPPKHCQLIWKSMIFRYFGFHCVTCPQPLDLPFSCGAFNDPLSSIGSVVLQYFGLLTEEHRLHLNLTAIENLKQKISFIAPPPPPPPPSHVYNTQRTFTQY